MDKESNEIDEKLSNQLGRLHDNFNEGWNAAKNNEKSVPKGMITQEDVNEFWLGFYANKCGLTELKGYL